MKKWIALFSLLILMVSGSGWAENIKKIAILPFTVTSSENIDYIRDGVMDMLSSRISIQDKIEVLDKALVEDLVGKIRKEGFSQADVYVLGKKLEADYVVWGTIAKNSNSLDIEGKLLDLETNKLPVTTTIQSKGMDDIVPKINDFARRIDTHLLGQTPSTFETISAAASLPSLPSLPTREKQQTPVLTQETPAVDTLKSKKGTITAAVDPKAIKSTQVIPKQAVWTSQKMDAEFVGMDIGDVNNDGKNEIVAIDRKTVFIYKKNGNSLDLIQKISKNPADQFLAIDVCDINGSGTAQIFVSSVNQGIPDSFVLEYRNGTFIEVASDLKWLLRVMYVSGKPVLLAQSLGKADGPFETPILEVGWRDEEYTEIGKMEIPRGLSIYDIAIGSLGNQGPERIVALDASDYIRIFEKTDKQVGKLLGIVSSKEVLWKSDDKYGGTVNAFSTSQSASKKATKSINVRMFFHDLLNQGKRDLIVIRNKPSGTGFFSDAKSFTSSEVVDLEWSGKTFTTVWKSQKIDGYISDMQIKDLNNDGKNELVLAVTTGSTALMPAKSVIVSYPLENKISDSEGLTTR